MRMDLRTLVIVLEKQWPLRCRYLRCHSFGLDAVIDLALASSRDCHDELSLINGILGVRKEGRDDIETECQNPLPIFWLRWWNWQSTRFALDKLRFVVCALEFFLTVKFPHSRLCNTTTNHVGRFLLVYQNFRIIRGDFSHR